VEFGPQRVPFQPIPAWASYQANSILGAHIGTMDYMLSPQEIRTPHGGMRSYDKNEDIWRDLIERRVDAGTEIVLKGFHVLDWFPPAPGLYHTRDAADVRSEAFDHLHRGSLNAPISRDQASLVGKNKRSSDYTAVFTPEGKFSMLQGGVGCVRLKPVQMFGGPHWLITASSDGVAHTGLPLALPRKLYAALLDPLRLRGAARASITGELEYIQAPFSRLFDATRMVRRLLLRVTGLEFCEPVPVTLETSVAVSFVSDYQGSPKIYVTYVTFRPDVKGFFEEAVSWMKTEYVEGEYHGRIITDFDQTQTVFPEARLALAKVMDRLISRGELRETIELMHATGSVDSYFDEVARRELLPGKTLEHRTKIFISYAHAAENSTGWVSRIRTHLEGVVRSSEFEIWDDSRIDAGERWRDEIEKAINQTRVAVLVLTGDFLASKFIREAELPLLLEAADAAMATILCVYASAVHLSGNAERLSRYQFVNSPERPLQALSGDAQESLYAQLAKRVAEVLTA